MDRLWHWCATRNGRWFIPLTTALAAILWLAVLHLASLWNSPWWSPLAALLLGGLSCSLAVPQARLALRRWDWRLPAMLAATTVAIAITLVGFDLGWHHPGQPNSFWHGVFGNWVGSVVFFAAIGLAVAIVPMVHPAREPYEARARNLFRGAEGEHIRFLIGQLRDVQANYAELVEETFTVRDYHAGTGRFRVDEETRTVIRSAINDVRTAYASTIRMSDVAVSPDPSHPNLLTFVEVNGQPRPGREFVNGAVSEAVNTVIEPGSSCEAKYGMQYWVQAIHEQNMFEPARFTRRARLTVRNQVNGGRTLNVRIDRGCNGHFLPMQIPPGGSVVIYEGTDLPPDRPLYDFRLDSLT